jgi:hypothetical protein
MWTKRDAELDQKLHDDEFHEPVISKFSYRGACNLGVLILLVGGLIALFAAYPIVQFYGQTPANTPALVRAIGSYNVGGINASGQIPSIPGLPTLIDSSTPASAYTHTGQDGAPYRLMFSDEFNVDGRT